MKEYSIILTPFYLIALTIIYTKVTNKNMVKVTRLLS